MISQNCPDCHFSIPQDWTTCPHCARPSRFPNVLMAEETEERNALDGRYQQAIRDANTGDRQTVVQRFEAALETSQAVINRPFEEVLRLATNDKLLFATY